MGSSRQFAVVNGAHANRNETTSSFRNIGSSSVHRCLTRRCTRRGAVRWPGTKVACLLETWAASRPLHLAPCGATISRGSGRAALPLACEGAARVSARSVRRPEYVVDDMGRE